MHFFNFKIIKTVSFRSNMIQYYDKINIKYDQLAAVSLVMSKKHMSFIVVSWIWKCKLVYKQEVTIKKFCHKMELPSQKVVATAVGGRKQAWSHQGET